MDRVFDTTGPGWLRYTPLQHNALPSFDVDRPRLHWVGASTGSADYDDSLPAEVVASWPWRLATPTADANGRVSIDSAIAAGLPDDLPVAVAYHLAVTRELAVPVAGLSAAVVRSVLDAELTLDARYQAAALHLKGVAEAEVDQPTYAGFDTVVRERLFEFAVDAARVYFYVLGDCLRDRESSWLWRRAAPYLWLVGLTNGKGAALVGLTAEALEAHAGTSVSFVDASTGRRTPIKKPSDVGELLERLVAWEKTGRAHALDRSMTDACRTFYDQLKRR